MNKNVKILLIIAVVVVLIAAGVAIHHAYLMPASAPMPMK